MIKKIGTEYQEVEYLQFSAKPWFYALQRFVGFLTWPLVIPMALISRISDIAFCSFSELVAIVPYFPGVSTEI